MRVEYLKIDSLSVAYFCCDTLALQNLLTSRDHPKAEDLKKFEKIYISIQNE